MGATFFMTRLSGPQKRGSTGFCYGLFEPLAEQKCAMRCYNTNLMQLMTLLSLSSLLPRQHHLAGVAVGCGAQQVDALR